MPAHLGMWKSNPLDRHRQCEKNLARTGLSGHPRPETVSVIVLRETILINTVERKSSIKAVGESLGLFVAFLETVFIIAVSKRQSITFCASGVISGP